MSTGIGETLQAAREDQGRTFEELARTMRVRAEQLRALEEERFAIFGGDVYARGFLKNYAVELGIDPQPLLDIHRRELASDGLVVEELVAPGGVSGGGRSRKAVPAWIGWLLAAAVIVGGLAVVGQLFGRTPEVASTEPPPQSVDPVTPGPTERTDPGPTVSPSPTPTPTPTFSGVELLLALEEESWMRVVVDGTVVYEAIAARGETLSFSGEEEVVIRYGQPGGVRVEKNGQDLGAAGARGQPVTISYTPEDESEV